MPTTPLPLPEITYLFVPASRPDRFAKALDAGADRVIIDLEDAVAPDAKPAARAALAQALSAGLPSPAFIRINPKESADFDDDLTMLAGLSEQAVAGVAGIMLPKCDSPDTVAAVRAAFAINMPVIALIETASGVARAADVAAAAGVARLALGAADLAVDLDVDVSSPLVDVVYAQLVIASRVAGLPSPIGSPYFTISDPEGAEREARRLRSLGVLAQLCIHPRLLTPAVLGFAPSAEQVAWARQLVGTDDGAATVAGQMVDRPVRERAERILAWHARTGAGHPTA